MTNFVSLPRRRAACAAVVMESASSRTINLKPELVVIKKESEYHSIDFRVAVMKTVGLISSNANPRAELHSPKYLAGTSKVFDLLSHHFNTTIIRRIELSSSK